MKTLLPLFILLFLFSSCEKETALKEYEPLNYQVVFGKKLAGYHKSSRDAEGVYHFEFEYNDRGRGPHLEEAIRLDAEGFIEELNITGHNYLKDTVNENFLISGNEYQWKSTTEEGTASTKTKAFYSSFNGTYGSTELMVQKLLEQPDEPLKTLPGGTIKVTGREDKTLRDSLNLTLLELTGSSFTPFYVWLDENNRLFASVYSWMSVIREGYTSMIEELLTIQFEKEDAFYKKLAEELTQLPEQAVVIKNVNLFDARSGEMIPDKSVVVRGNRIEEVLDGSESTPKEATVIDGSGKSLLPGLFDMHVHISKIDGILNLAAGVTSVRDLGNALMLPDMKNSFDKNDLIGPRVVLMSGFIDKAGPFAGPTGKIVNSLEEGLEAIDFYYERGYGQIKLYSSIEPEWVKPLADKAHERGMRVSGHIPAHMLAEDAVKSGYDEIQHTNMLVLNFLSDTIDTRTPLRFTMVGDHAHRLDLQGPEFQAFVQLLKEKNITIDPTISIFEGMLTGEPGKPSPIMEPILERLPIEVQRSAFSGGLPKEGERASTYPASFRKMLDMIRVLYESGVTIVPGTDAMAGFAYHKELENYVKAGIPAAEVLKIATLGSASVIGLQDQLGSIEKGKLADLILVDGNPAENISDIRRVELTIKDGKIYRSAELYEAIGVLPVRNVE